MKTILILGLILSQNLISQNSLSKEQAFETVIEILNSASNIEYANDLQVISKNFKKTKITIKGYREGNFLVADHNRYFHLNLNQLKKVEKVKSYEYDTAVELHFKKEITIQIEEVGKYARKRKESFKSDSLIIDFESSVDVDKLIMALNTFIID